MGSRSKSAGDGDLGPTNSECDIIVLFPCCWVAQEEDFFNEMEPCGKPSVAPQNGAYVPYACEEHNRRK